jgi:hypothetical protein
VSNPGRFTPGKETWCPLYRKWVGSRAGLGRYTEVIQNCYIDSNNVFKSTVVTIYTTSFNIIKAYILPTKYIHVLCTDIFPKLNRLIFIKENSCVLCGAGVEFLYLMQINFSL